jgi:hypothetical protein
MKRTEEPEPAVSYHAADEEVPTDDLPEIYQEADFATTGPAAVPPPAQQPCHHHHITLPCPEVTARPMESSTPA